MYKTVRSTRNCRAAATSCAVQPGIGPPTVPRAPLDVARPDRGTHRSHRSPASRNLPDHPTPRPAQPTADMPCARAWSAASDTAPREAAASHLRLRSRARLRDLQGPIIFEKPKPPPDRRQRRDQAISLLLPSASCSVSSRRIGARRRRVFAVNTTLVGHRSSERALREAGSFNG
jgi:hypothetical protein